MIEQLSFIYYFFVSPALWIRRRGKENWPPGSLVALTDEADDLMERAVPLPVLAR